MADPRQTTGSLHIQSVWKTMDTLHGNVHHWRLLPVLLVLDPPRGLFPWTALVLGGTCSWHRAGWVLVVWWKGALSRSHLWRVEDDWFADAYTWDCQMQHSKGSGVWDICFTYISQCFSTCHIWYEHSCDSDSSSNSSSTSTSMLKTKMSVAYLHFTICNAVSLVFASHHGFTFVVTWSGQSVGLSEFHSVQDTPYRLSFRMLWIIQHLWMISFLLWGLGGSRTEATYFLNWF